MTFFIWWQMPKCETTFGWIHPNIIDKHLEWWSKFHFFWTILSKWKLHLVANTQIISISFGVNSPNVNHNNHLGQIIQITRSCIWLNHTNVQWIWTFFCKMQPNIWRKFTQCASFLWWTQMRKKIFGIVSPNVLNLWMHFSKCDQAFVES